MKKLLLLSLAFILVSCSSTKVEEEIVDTLTWQTLETNSWGKVDTKQLEQDLANDLNEIMNLVPNE